MGKIRGSNGNCLNAILTLCFFRKHGLVIRIATFCSDADILSKLFSACSIYVESACNKLEQMVSLCGTSVNITDLASAASAYHTPADWLL